MAGQLIEINGSPWFIDYADGFGSAEIDGKTWSWEFHNYLGPTFLKKDGEPRRCQFPRNKKVWAAFENWLKEYQTK